MISYLPFGKALGELAGTEARARQGLFPLFAE
jgi:hypothetical protein